MTSEKPNNMTLNFMVSLLVTLTFTLINEALVKYLDYHTFYMLPLFCFIYIAFKRIKL
jgi:hypothetical protein